MSRLDLSQIEQLREIGDYLSQVRQQQAVPLEEVAARTFIPLRLLRALEAGQPDILPEAVFVQGFIRRYADLLGLDGIAIARSFQTEPKPVTPEPIAEPQPQAAAVSIAEPPPVKPQAAPKAERPPAEPLNLSWVPYAFITVVSVGVLGFVLNQFLSSPKTARNEAQTQSATATSNRSSLDSAPASSPATEPEAIASPSPSVSAAPQSDAPIQVTITLTDESWVQITSDDKVLLEGIFKKGYRKTWAAKNELILEAGNAGGVKFSFNQGEEKVVGQLGDIGVIRFTPEKAEVQAIN